MREPEAYSALPTSPSKAKELGLKHYYTGVPCLRNHLSKRYASNQQCVECLNEYPKEKARESARRYRERHPELCRKRSQASRRKNLPYYRESLRRWRQENPEKARAQVRLRQARQKNATPDWINPSEFIPIYWLAATKTEFFGIKYEVDHIIPLSHENVCGLHVPWNLRVITAEDNRRKNNKLLEELIYEAD